MLSIELIQEIDRLLREGELSQRQIAARLQVSRGTVGAIASGRRGGKGWDDADQALRAKRCRRCGYRIYPPCRICIAREHRRQSMAKVKALLNRNE
jgi:hypothetical protein